ncbi:MAG: hypothetical protein IJK04_10320 [Kiritimatiellae bacterium]|nr:hypothetical protein [Kiritimatiellia bacterium]
MKRLQQHPALCGALAAMALGGVAAFADSSLFPNGEPNWSALRTSGSHSVESTAIALDAAYPASVFSAASALEARSSTSCASAPIALRSDKFTGMIITVR